MKVVDAVAKERGVPVTQIIKEWADLMPTRPRPTIQDKQLLMEKIYKGTGVQGLAEATTEALNGLYFLFVDKVVLPKLEKGTKADYIASMQVKAELPLKGLSGLSKLQLVTLHQLLEEQ